MLEQYLHNFEYDVANLSFVIKINMFSFLNQWLECDSFVFAVYYFPWIHVRIFAVYGILVFCYEI